MQQRLTRQQIFAMAAAKLRQDFNELRTIPHRGVKGSEAESIVKRFLNEHMPQRFKATSGFIIDRNDGVTGHNDVIVYDALNCPLYRVSDDAAIIPNDNVAIVIEVKSRLNKADMQNAAEKIREAKSLVKSATDPKDEPAFYETFGVLFAFTSEISSETALEHYMTLTKEVGIPRQVDMIVVLDGFILLPMVYFNNGWAPIYLFGLPPVEGAHIALGAVEYGENTIDAFMRYMLPHLHIFRHKMDHPGFELPTSNSDGKARLSYLTSVTLEVDPERKEFLSAVYREQARSIMTGV